MIYLLCFLGGGLLAFVAMLVDLWYGERVRDRRER